MVNRSGTVDHLVKERMARRVGYYATRVAVNVLNARGHSISPKHTHTCVNGCVLY